MRAFGAKIRKAPFQSKNGTERRRLVTNTATVPFCLRPIGSKQNSGNPEKKKPCTIVQLFSKEDAADVPFLGYINSSQNAITFAPN
jgi:hypothetical protein